MAKLCHFLFLLGVSSLHVDVKHWIDRAFGKSAVVLSHFHVDVPVLNKLNSDTFSPISYD